MSIGLGLIRGDCVMDGMASLMLSMGVSGASTPKPYSVGRLFDGKVTLVPEAKQNDSLGRNKEATSKLHIEAKMIYTNKANAIKIQDYLCGNYLDVIATMVNGTTFTSALLTNKNVGYMFEFDGSKDCNGFRYIQIIIERIINISEIPALIGSNTAVLAYATADTTLAKLASLTEADAWAAGMTNYSLAPTGSAIENIGVIQEGKLQCKSVSIKVDNLGRPIATSISLHSEVIGVQGSAVELGLMPAVMNQIVDHSITLLDGTIFKSVAQQGSSEEYEASTDSKGNAMMKFTGDGIIPLTAWGALWN